MKTAVFLLAALAATAHAGLKPEQIVTSTAGKFNVACATPGALERFIEHSVAGEKTKMMGMMPTPCTNFPAGQRYKILSVQRTMVEFTHETSKGSEGVWTVIEAFQPAN